MENGFSASASVCAPVAIPTRRRQLVAWLLVAALVCNVTMLFLPFMDLRVGLVTTPYSLLRSVRMLWESELYVLAILVVGFSLIFPFGKLGVLAWVCAARQVDARRMRWLAAVESLGKWSMLDVLLVCLILTLTSGQLLVGARPLAGIPVFTVAVLLSMTAGELISAALHRPASPRVVRVPAVAGLWLALAGVALVGTVSLPFLRINDWLLADRSYSILTLAPALWAQGAYFTVAITSLFLVIAPAAAWWVSFLWWRRQRRGGDVEASHGLMRLLRRWDMLDVFGLSLAIFLVEGDYLMSTEVRWGALFLVAMLALRWAFQLALDRAFLKELRAEQVSAD